MDRMSVKIQCEKQKTGIFCFLLPITYAFLIYIDTVSTVGYIIADTESVKER